MGHRLEDYMADLSHIPAQRSKDIQFYIDRMREIILRAENPGEEEGRALLLTLPVFKEDTEVAVDELPTEILLVSESRTIRRKIGDDLGSFGFRVIDVSNAMDALTMAVIMQPDIIITTEVMKGINGFDLIRALIAMNATKDIPVALLTSYDAEHPDILSLPDQVPVIQMDRDMSDQLALTLSALEYRFLDRD